MLEFVKNYMRVDFIDDDAQIQIFIGMSREFIFNATGCTIDDNIALDQIALAMTTKHFYDNRDAIIIGTMSMKIPLSLNSIYMQLQNRLSVETV